LLCFTIEIDRVGDIYCQGHNALLSIRQHQAAARANARRAAGSHAHHGTMQPCMVSENNRQKITDISASEITESQ